MKKSQGFAQIIALIIIFVVIALYLGKNPLGIWNDSIKPFMFEAFKFIIRAVEFIIWLATESWQRSR